MAGCKYGVRTGYADRGNGFLAAALGSGILAGLVGIQVRTRRGEEPGLRGLPRLGRECLGRHALPGAHEIGWAQLPEDLRAAPSAPRPADDLRTNSRQTLKQVLADCAGNRAEAARRLGISRSSVYRALARL